MNDHYIKLLLQEADEDAEEEDDETKPAEESTR